MRQADILQALEANTLERKEAINNLNITRLIELQNVRIMLLELLVKEVQNAA